MVTRAAAPPQAAIGARPGVCTVRAGCYTSRRMARSRRARILLLATALAAFASALIVPGLAVGVLFLSPAIVLLTALLNGCYVGEKRLHRLAAAFRPSGRRRPRAAPVPRVLRRRALMPRGGSLVATSLAVRPPPQLLVAR
jgi:hypothetical protein